MLTDTSTDCNLRQTTRFRVGAGTRREARVAFEAVMGWESTLHVGEHLVGIWRKYAPSYSALLFQRTDVVTADPRDPNDDSASASVVWSTSVASAVANLAAAGFTWEQLLSDYAASRKFSMEAAFLQGQLKARIDAREYERLIAALNEQDPAQELRLLAEAVQVELDALAACRRKDMAADPQTPLCDALFFEQDDGDRRLPLATTLNPQAQLSLTRAADYFRRSIRSAPLVGWAFSLLEFLHHSDAAVRIEFDISGGVGQVSDEPAAIYAEAYWSDSRSALAELAGFYGRVFIALSRATADIGVAARFGRIEALLVAARAPGLTTTEKGHRLEELVDAILGLPDTKLPVVEKRLKHADEELDLVLRNELDGSFWRNFQSPVLLVECKNWSSRVDIAELRVLETKMNDRLHLCRVGIFVSLYGFTKPFLERCRDLHGRGITVFPVSGADLSEMVASRRTMADWLRDEGLRRVI